jgi:hypothetical protein
MAVLAATVAGCASMPPVLRQESHDFTSTGLFIEACNHPEKSKDARRGRRPVHPVTASEPAPASMAAEGREETTGIHQCNIPDLDAMVERFLAIHETDERRGIPGDTIEDVRRKGFSIFLDVTGRVRRPNTRQLYGNDALSAVGMAVSPPQLQTPDEIKVYTDFMAKLYAEEYVEKDVLRVTDRICVNTHESHEFGDERTFAIVWKDGRVFKRVIKGGPIDRPRRERALLLCPTRLIGGAVQGRMLNAIPLP